MPPSLRTRPFAGVFAAIGLLIGLTAACGTQESVDIGGGGAPTISGSSSAWVSSGGPSRCDLRVGLGAACALDTDCADADAVCADSPYAGRSCEGLLDEFDGDGFGLPGICKRRCAADADCGGVGSGVCHVGASGGVCAVSCDALTNDGCVKQCKLFQRGDGAAADCVAGDAYCGTPGWLALTLGQVELVEGTLDAGSAGVACGHLCRLGHDEDCPATTDAAPPRCVELDTGALEDTITGRSYGTCRTPCDTSGCGNFSLCMLDEQPGKAPVSDCLDNSASCYPDPVYTPYPNDARSYCYAPSWSSCTNSCAAAADCPTGQVCVPPNQLPPSACPGPACRATCLLPPLACEPEWSDPGCAAGQSCAASKDASGAWQFGCVPQGAGTYPMQCSVSAGGCAQGYVCIAYDDSDVGFCEATCVFECNDPQVCSVHASVPRGTGYSTLSTCTTPCDLTNPAMACPGGMTCVPAEGGLPGTTSTDCAPTTGVGTGPGACAADPFACAPGYTCRASDGACLPWCFVGQPASCAADTSCVAMTPPLVTGNVEYGTCQ